MEPFAALVLSGGASRRMGSDKAVLQVYGRRAVDRVVSLAEAAGAAFTLTVGGPSYGHPFVADASPFGGPVGGIIAGARALIARGYTRALVLAVDTPTLLVEDLAPLLARPGGGAYEGMHLPFVADVSQLPPDCEADWPIRRLISALGLTRIPVPQGATERLRGANTPEEFQALTATDGAGS